MNDAAKVLEIIDNIAAATKGRYGENIPRSVYEADIKKIKTYVDLGFYLKENYKPEEDKNNG